MVDESEELKDYVFLFNGGQSLYVATDRGIDTRFNFMICNLINFHLCSTIRIVQRRSITTRF